MRKLRHTPIKLSKAIQKDRTDLGIESKLACLSYQWQSLPLHSGVHQRPPADDRHASILVLVLCSPTCVHGSRAQKAAHWCLGTRVTLLGDFQNRADASGQEEVWSPGKVSWGFRWDQPAGHPGISPGLHTFYQIAV